MKLTPARRKALEWFRDNDGAKFYSINISRSVRKALIDGGMLREDNTTENFFVRTFVTPAGRLALEQNEKEG